MIHRVVRSDYSLWKPIWEQIVQPNNNCYIASTTRPTGTGGDDSPSGGSVPVNKWAKVLTSMTPEARDATSVVNEIVATLSNNEAQLIVFDELQTNNKQWFTDIAETLRQNYPQFNGRWGTYIVFGKAVSFTNFKNVLTSFMKANAPIFPEFYFNYIDYCSIDRTDYAKRDAWLKTQIDGNSSLGRLKFLDELRTDLNSSSSIAPIITVTDSFNDGATPFKMIDRVMWALLNSSLGLKYGTLAGAGNLGGIGSWKWDTTAMDPDNVGRANEFVDSWNNYCKQKKKTARSGTGYPTCGPDTNSGIRNTAAMPPTAGAEKEFVTQVRSKPLLDRKIDKLEDSAGRARLYRSTYKPTLGTIETKPQIETASILDLYVHEVTYGYAVEGEDHMSKYYSRFYPTSAVLRDVTVSGKVRDEREYEDLTYWIRDVQSDIAKGYVSYMGLIVPTTGVNIWGYIPTMTVNLGGQNNPIPVGIDYQFTMVIIKDLTDPKNILSNDVGTVVAGFYNDNPYWKAQISNFEKDWYVGEALAKIETVSKKTIAVGKSITHEFSIGAMLQDWFER